MSSLIAGKYEVLETLGESVAGTTYKVRHTLLDSVLTLTLLPDDLARDVDRLGRVQRAVRNTFELKHEHVVRVLDLGCEADRYHLVEAFVEADPLDRVLKQRRSLPPADALQLAWQLADALAYAHERGVVHGALTPSAVLIERAAVPRALLSGFVAAEVAATASGLVPALAPYTAPERLAPAEGATPDPRSDVFALGMILFEMLEGKAFFAGKSEAEVADVLRDTSGPLLPRFSSILPSGVSAVVARAIRRVPADRQQGMAQLRREIDACSARQDRPKVASTVSVAAESAPEAPPLRPAAPSPRPAASAPRPVEPVAPAPRPVLVISPPPSRPVVKVAPADEARPPRERVLVRPAELDPPTVPVGEEGMSAERIVAKRLLEAAGVRPAARRRVPIASGALVIVVLALGWLLFRPARKAPAAPGSSTRPVAEASARPQPTSGARPVPAAKPEPPPAAAPAPEPVEPQAPTAAAPVPVAPPPAVPAREEAATPPPAAAERLALARTPEEPERAERNLPPRIASSRPRAGSPVTVLEGETVDFSVSAKDANTNARLTYAWFLDGDGVGRRPTWRFTAPLASTGTTHRVEVQVTDAAGLKAPRLSWSIEVTPRMSEANVRDWLGRLAAAWERKDIATLRLFGVVTSDAQADEVRKWATRHDGYRVSFRDEAIRTQGQYATVTVERVDLDGRGKTIASRQESYELEKRASGFVAQRAR